MPTPAPLTPAAVAERLGAIGLRIRQHRRELRITASNAAAAAGMSRVTLHRIEHGEPSVTMGAYLNAMSALGLEFDIHQPLAAPTHAQLATQAKAGTSLPAAIDLADYPQLRRLAWHLPGATQVTPREALGLYERNWRHLDREAMDSHEEALLDQLVHKLGGGHLLV